MLQDNPLLELAETDEWGGEIKSSGTDSVTAPAESSTPESSAAETSNEHESSTAVDEFSDMNWGDEGGGGHTAEGDEDGQDYPQQAAESTTLRQHLIWQLNLTQLSNRDNKLVSLLIDALDEDGYLTQSLDELAGLLPDELEVEPIELQIALKHLQNFDPPGVGARNLSECLALQLEAMSDETPFRDKATLIVKDHLETLAARDYSKLKRVLHCDDDCLRTVQSLITHLNPRPGADFSQTETRYIVSDVIVKKVKGMWIASLNQDAMPKLRINRMYADILQRNRDSSTQQLAGQLQEAKWLIKNVQQRFETILRVSQAIVDRQRHFFEHGEVAMRPLVLREIADSVELHESTISRVTSQKFMHTPRGIFELKYFFGSHVSTEAGGACSATAIRALIKQLVGAEDPQKPLSDSQLADILGKQGIVVARRTIAKYREALQIHSVNLRKSI